MEWCITHHIRAQYIETRLQCYEMNYPTCSDAKYNEYERQFLASPILLILVLAVLFVFWCPAKPGIAKDLIEADDIGRKAVADFIDSLFVENLSFTSP